MKTHHNHILRRAVLASMLALGTHAIAAAPASAPVTASAPLTDWPRITSAVKQDKAMEARIAGIVAGMTLSLIHI